MVSAVRRPICNCQPTCSSFADLSKWPWRKFHPEIFFRRLDRWFGCREGDEIHLAAADGCPGGTLDPTINPVRPQHPRLGGVGQGDPENFADDAVAQDAILNREHDLDAAKKVPWHPVRDSDESLRLARVCKIA